MFLDTTFLVDFLRGKKKALTLMKKIEFNLLFTSEINVFELVEGVYIFGGDIRLKLEKINSLLTKITVLPFDRRAALEAGMISGNLVKKGLKIGETDCLIAGVAMSNGLNEIITENKSHFEKTGLKVITYD